MAKYKAPNRKEREDKHYTKVKKHGIKTRTKRGLITKKELSKDAELAEMIKEERDD